MKKYISLGSAILFGLAQTRQQLSDNNQQQAFRLAEAKCNKMVKAKIVEYRPNSPNNRVHDSYPVDHESLVTDRSISSHTSTLSNKQVRINRREVTSQRVVEERMASTSQESLSNSSHSVERDDRRNRATKRDEIKVTKPTANPLIVNCDNPKWSAKYNLYQCLCWN